MFFVYLPWRQELWRESFPRRRLSRKQPSHLPEIWNILILILIYGGSSHLDILGNLLGCLPVLVLGLEVDLALHQQLGDLAQPVGRGAVQRSLAVPVSLELIFLFFIFKVFVLTRPISAPSLISLLTVSS